MSRTVGLLVATLLSVGLAGCIAGTDEPTEPIERTTVDGVPLWAVDALPFGEGHDHYDHADHQDLSTSNFEVLGWDPLATDYYGAGAGGYLCGDATGADERTYGVVHSLSTDVAFVLVDLTDPASPEKVAEFVLPRTGSRDVAITADGAHVAIASTGPTTSTEGPLAAPDAADAAPTAEWRTACGTIEVPLLTGAGPETDAPLPPGVILVNVEDPAEPFIESVAPLPGIGAHSVTTGLLGDEQIITASVTNLATPAVEFYFFNLVEGPDGTELALRNLYQNDPTAGNAPLINGHNDAWVQEHPVTGQGLAYLANWHQGVTILDISQPGVTTVVGHWSDNPGPHAQIGTDGTGNVHEAIPLEGTWDDRHYTFIGQEIIGAPSERASGWVRVLDTTDPSSPEVVAEWSLAQQVPWDESLLWSSHYLTLHEKTLFVAHYHAGVWAIDLSNLTEDPVLPGIGAFVPANEPPEATVGQAYSWAPTVMDVNALPDGTLVVWDSTSGVYTVKFDASNPMMPAPPATFPGLG